MKSMKGQGVTLPYFGIGIIEFLLIVIGFVLIVAFFIYAFPSIAEAARNLFVPGN